MGPQILLPAVEQQLRYMPLPPISCRTRAPQPTTISCTPPLLAVLVQLATLIDASPPPPLCSYPPQPTAISNVIIMAPICLVPTLALVQHLAAAEVHAPIPSGLASLCAGGGQAGIVCLQLAQSKLQRPGVGKSRAAASMRHWRGKSLSAAQLFCWLARLLACSCTSQLLLLAEGLTEQ